MTAPDTLCSRVCTVLASVGPLTPKQLGVALNYPHAAVLLAYLRETGRVERVEATSRQRHDTGGQRSAYALVAR